MKPTEQEACIGRQLNLVARVAATPHRESDEAQWFSPLPYRVVARPQRDYLGYYFIKHWRHRTDQRHGLMIREGQADLDASREQAVEGH